MRGWGSCGRSSTLRPPTKTNLQHKTQIFYNESVSLLIITASYGLGHKIATEGLKDALKEKNISYSTMDVVDEGGFVEKFVSKWYEILAVHARWLLPLFTPNKLTGSSPIKAIYRLLYKNKYEKAIAKHKPSIIISNHHIAILAAIMYKKKYPETKVYAVITDYGVHPLWFWEGVEKYFVASDHTKSESLLCGAKEESIMVTGIPLRKQFWKTPTKQEARKKLNIPKESIVALVSIGSFGSTKIDELINSFRQYNEVYLIILAGKDKNEVEDYKQKLYQNSINGTVLGFIDYVPTVMAASDIFLTKAGGIISTEAINSGLAMVLFDNIPVQEVENAELFDKLNLAINAEDSTHAIKTVQMLLKSPEKIKTLQKNTKKLANPKSSKTIIQTIFNKGK